MFCLYGYRPIKFNNIENTHLGLMNVICYRPFFLSPHFYDVDALLIIESGQGYNSLPIKSNQHSYVMSPFHQDCFGPDNTDPFLVDRPQFCKK